jgi:GDP-mannose 6-dehydrogenase
VRVSIFGLGYVGCVTASCLAREGHEVVGVDTNPGKVKMVNGGVSPLVEPGLGEVLAAGVRAGRLRATQSTAEAVGASDLALVCVGTPSRPNGQLDVSALERVATDIGSALRGRERPFTVVLRSTALPGTTEDLLVPALKSGGGPAAELVLRVAVNPEFMREGSSLDDFVRPPFTLVGTADPETATTLQALYSGIGAPFVGTRIRTAEMVKYVANSFHALKVCFANEVGDVCEALQVDAQEVMRIFLLDRRLSVSEAYLRPGFAFGGSCLPKDVRGLLYAARGADLVPPVLSAILPSNESQVRHRVQEILATRKRRVGVVGLSFKPGTDDLRESPLVALVETLLGKGCDVRILDRNISVARLVGANRRYIEEEIPHVASLMCESVEELLAHAEVVVVGHRSDDADAVIAVLEPHHILIDLTRSVLRAPRPTPV